MRYRKSAWKVIQESTAVATSIGTLVLAIVALWITTRVSGIEDYFRSEIVYRNEQLVVATENVRQMDRQKSSLERKIFEQTSKLQSVTSDINSARAQLVKTSLQATQVSAALDLQLRAQTFATLEMAGCFNLLQYDDKTTSSYEIPLGSNYLAAVAKAAKDARLVQIKKYILKARAGMQRTCPALLSEVFVVPAVIPMETIPKPQLNSTNAKEAQIAWDAYRAAYSEAPSRNMKSERVRTDATIKGHNEFYDKVKNCLCSALADAGTKQAVCKSYPAL